MIILPGRSGAVLGPSGTGKSHLVASALRHYGSGIVICVPGSDEMESYSEFYSDAEQPTWNEKGEVSIPTDAPFILAPFDDADFAPSLGTKGLSADAQERMVFFLRAIRQVVQKDVNEGSPPRWRVIAQDTFSAISTLSSNATLDEMKIISPPAAMSPDGAKYYGKIATRMNDVARASRVLKGLGLDWLTTSHVKTEDVDDEARPSTKPAISAKKQYMPLMTGAFREAFLPMFDITLHSEVTGARKWEVRCEMDMNRQSRARGATKPMSPTGYLPNDWPTILEAYDAAR